jgi:hypothetical protein
MKSNAAHLGGKYKKNLEFISSRFKKGNNF